MSQRQRGPDGIFVSYRRDDSAGHAGRLFDKLVARFGERRVFMDVNAIQPGMDFRTAIDGALSASSVVLAVIGRRWLDAANPDGSRRLDEPNDLVRLEISTAIERGLDITPVTDRGHPVRGRGRVFRTNRLRGAPQRRVQRRRLISA